MKDQACKGFKIDKTVPHSRYSGGISCPFKTLFHLTFLNLLIENSLNISVPQYPNPWNGHIIAPTLLRCKH